MQRGSIRAFIMLLAVGAASFVEAAAPIPQADEYAVKAAFLYNFARFVEWPAEAFADADAPLRICVLGKEPFGAHLDPYEARHVQGRRVDIMDPGASTSLARTCHVLFIGRAEPDAGATLAQLADFPVLTVTEIDAGAGRRGIINLVKEWSSANGGSPDRFRIVFEIDVGAAENARLLLGSRLLELALVRNQPR